MSIRANARALFLAGGTAILMAAAAAPGHAQTVDRNMFTPAAPVVYDWSGVYAGVSAGASWDTFDTLFGVAPVSTSFDPSNFTAGAYAGMNFQNGPFVYGLELDVNFKTGDDTQLIAGVPVTAQNDWFSTLRGRAGYAYDRYLFYGTGGLAVGDVELSAPGTSFSDTKVGWTIGAGIEAAINDRITLRGEYLYTDLGKVDGSLGGSPFTTEFDSHTVRAGVTYKFQ
ncbi:outer membrane protein [Microbaculum marinum]|uniref:Outer membrane protein n=1 Tax=Microbaculum marinum TaxID=1764581 RepID=A0AAW9RTB1_9HYPH